MFVRVGDTVLDTDEVAYVKLTVSTECDDLWITFRHGGTIAFSGEQADLLRRLFTAAMWEVRKNVACHAVVDIAVALGETATS